MWQVLMVLFKGALISLGVFYFSIAIIFIIEVMRKR